MKVTERQFQSVTELRLMIKGFEMLFGCTPIVDILVYGPNGGTSSTFDKLTGELVFFPCSGFTLSKIGHKLLTLKAGQDHFQIDLNDIAVTFHAAFYLP